MSDRCEHGPGCAHWDKIVVNGRRFSAMVSKAQRTKAWERNTPERRTQRRANWESWAQKQQRKPGDAV